MFRYLPLLALGLAACSADTGSVPGNYSVDDFQRDYPGIDQAAINRIDSDLDGNITENELQAARANGEI